jgi:hypothetical protein
VQDDTVCRRVLGALRSAYGLQAAAIAVAEVRGAYITFVVPHNGATYVLDRDFRPLDVLIVPS